MAVYGYVRVSHQDSVDSGLSVPAQKKAIHEFCKRHFPGEEVEFYVDLAQSAWKKPFYARPQGSRLRQIMERGDHVVFFRLDRGFRSVMDFSKTAQYWLDEGINIHFVDQQFDITSANGRLWANVLAAYAQYKSDIISERTKAGLARRKLMKEQRKLGVKEQWAPSIAVRPPKKEQRDQFEPAAQRVFSYARVSHRDSLDGYSLQAQKDAIDAYIKAKLGHLRRCEHYQDEAVSAYEHALRDRPAGSQLNSVLQEGDHVVFTRIDRLWRSTIDMARTWEDWKGRGVTIHFTDTPIDTTTAAGEAFMELLAIFAKHESADSGDRIRVAMAQAKAEGRPVNQEIPLGFKVIRHGGKKVFAPCKRRIGQLWHVNLMAKHGMGPTAISDWMEKIEAHLENRREIPRGGIPEKMRLHKVWQGHPRSKWRTHRFWSRARVSTALRQWPQVQELLSGMSE